MADAKKYFDMLGLSEYWSKYKSFVEDTTDAIDEDSLTDIFGEEISLNYAKIITNFVNIAPSDDSLVISDYEPTYTLGNTKSLTITADDVSGRKSTTTIHYTEIKEVLSPTGEVIASDYEVTGTVTSSDFGQNTSETETKTITITYTKDGKTATTTITQGVWVNEVTADYILVNDSTYVEELGWNNSWSAAQGWSVDTENNPDTSKYALYSTDFTNYGQDGTIYSSSDWESITDTSKATELDNCLYGKITGVTEFTAYIANINVTDWDTYYSGIQLTDSSDTSNSIYPTYNSSDDIDDIFKSDSNNCAKCIFTGLDSSKTYYVCAYAGISKSDGISSIIEDYKNYTTKILVPLSLS